MSQLFLLCWHQQKQIWKKTLYNEQLALSLPINSFLPFFQNDPKQYEQKHRPDQDARHILHVQCERMPTGWKMPETDCVWRLWRRVCLHPHGEPEVVWPTEGDMQTLSVQRKAAPPTRVHTHHQPHPHRKNRPIPHNGHEQTGIPTLLPDTKRGSAADSGRSKGNRGTGQEMRRRAGRILRRIRGNVSVEITEQSERGGVKMKPFVFLGTPS